MSPKSQSESVQLLKDRGWRERGTNVRRWYHRNYPAALYKISDAVELERRKR